MIKFDASINSVTLDCDSPGCKNSHVVVSERNDDGRNAMNIMTDKMASDGWFMRVNGVNVIEHLCSRCGAGVFGFQPVDGRRRLPTGSAEAIGVVSAQDARRGIEPKKESTSRKKAYNSLGEIDDDDKSHIMSMINRGRKVFGDG
jgi:Tfp pilus assembly protein PilW